MQEAVHGSHKKLKCDKPELIENCKQLKIKLALMAHAVHGNRSCARSPEPPSVISESEIDADTDSETSVEYSTSTATASSNKLYLQLALYAGGNILTIVIVLGLWTVWSLLSAFRDAMLWALLCSTALQDVKEYIVRSLRHQLARDRSGYPPSSAFSPEKAFVGTMS